MILVDNRIGSACLVPPLQHLGIPCELTQLEYGDAAFVGNGPYGPMSIAIERKTLNDLIESMRNGRLTGHQLIGLRKNYDLCYLLIEGIFTPSYDGSGTIMQLTEKNYWRAIPQNSVKYKELDSFLCTLTSKCGVIVLKSANIWESSHILGNLHRWWSREWDEHESHFGMYTPKFMPTGGEVLLTKASLLRRIAKELEGVGYTRSKAVEQHFSSVEAMVNATVKQWMEIEGIGKITAERIVKSIRENV